MASTVGRSSSEKCDGAGCVWAVLTSDAGQRGLHATRDPEKDSRSASSAKIGLVLYQYTAPKARPHRATVPLQDDFLSAGAVLAYLRDADPRCVVGRTVRNAHGADLTAARYMTATG